MKHHEPEQPAESCACGEACNVKREAVDNESKGTNRRTFITRATRTLAIVSSGLIATANDRSVLAAPNCANQKARYKIAEEDGIITDALGTRFVSAGDYIVLPSPVCSIDDHGGEVGTESTASQCGVNSFNPGISATGLGNNWYELNCRECPWQGSYVRYVFSNPNSPIYISYATTNGQHICYGGWSCAGSSVWYRTSGSIGCWLWSGGTDHPNWNRACC